MKDERDALGVGEREERYKNNERYCAPHKNPANVKNRDIGEDDVFDIVARVRGRVDSRIKVVHDAAGKYKHRYKKRDLYFRFGAVDAVAAKNLLIHATIVAPL